MKKITSMKLDIVKCNQQIWDYSMHATQNLKIRQAWITDDPKKNDRYKLEIFPRIL
jgi:hypothetical protein